MKVVILAGGFGSRLSEETIDKPKPMVEVGLKPIICHIMQLYSHYGFNEFIICAGYKSNYIKSYFNEYMMNLHDITFDFKKNLKTYHKKKVDPWNITIVDTGLNTNTGGRIKKIKKFLGDDDNFFMTYGDGVGDINIKKLLNSHLKSNKIGCLTAIYDTQFFGKVYMANLKKRQDLTLWLKLLKEYKYSERYGISIDAINLCISFDESKKGNLIEFIKI